MSLPTAPGGIDDPFRPVGGARVATVRTIAHPFRASPWESKRTKRRRAAKEAKVAARKVKP